MHLLHTACACCHHKDRPQQFVGTASFTPPPLPLLTLHRHIICLHLQVTINGKFNITLRVCEISGILDTMPKLAILYNIYIYVDFPCRLYMDVAKTKKNRASKEQNKCYYASFTCIIGFAKQCLRTAKQRERSRGKISRRKHDISNSRKKQLPGGHLYANAKHNKQSRVVRERKKVKQVP